MMPRASSRRGRPELPPKEKQNAAFVVRLRPDELEALRQLAREAGYDGHERKAGVGAYARAVLRSHLRRKGRN